MQRGQCGVLVYCGSIEYVLCLFRGFCFRCALRYVGGGGGCVIVLKKGGIYWGNLGEIFGVWGVNSLFYLKNTTH
jgi:hypothetical protein